jgi:molybdate transport system regulatory protein
MGASASLDRHDDTAAGPSGERRERPERRHRGRGKRVSEIQPPPRIRAGHRVFFHEHGEPLFGPGTFDLLVLVDETGSLHQAAKLMGMSYNKAWRAMRQAEGHLGLKLLARRTGGAGGGGSVLTEDGVRLMERFRAFLDEADADLARLYQKYFGDASFAQPEQASEGHRQPEPAGAGRPRPTKQDPKRR